MAYAKPREYLDVFNVSTGQTRREHVDPVSAIHTARARTLQAEADRGHMLERLRDLAAMARDDTDPYLELEIFRLQAEINAPLLGGAK